MVVILVGTCLLIIVEISVLMWVQIRLIFEWAEKDWTNLSLKSKTSFFISVSSTLDHNCILRLAELLQSFQSFLTSSKIFADKTSNIYFTFIKNNGVIFFIFCCTIFQAWKCYQLLHFDRLIGIPDGVVSSNGRFPSEQHHLIDSMWLFREFSGNSL